MPLMDAAGTSVDRISPESVKNSTPPERIWFNVSVSEPNWLDGKICRSRRPSVSALMAAAISRARTFIGWVSGRLFAYLYVHCGFWARAMLGAPTRRAAPAADPSASKRRRDKSIETFPQTAAIVAKRLEPPNGICLRHAQEAFSLCPRAIPLDSYKLLGLVHVYVAPEPPPHGVTGQRPMCVKLSTLAIFVASGEPAKANVRSWRKAPVAPSTAFWRRLPVHGTGREGALKVETSPPPD